MSQCVRGTFSGVGQFSATLSPPEGSVSAPVISSNITFRLTTRGVNASNTVKLQKSIHLGMYVPPPATDGDWVDVTTYNSEQTDTVITPAPGVPNTQNVGEEYRLVCVAIQALHDIGYEMTRESLKTLPGFAP